MARSSARLGSAASAQLASASPSKVPNCRASTDRTDGLLQVPICHSVPREAAPRDAGSGTIDALPCDGLGFVTATDRRTGPCRARDYTLVDAVDGGWKAACKRPRRPRRRCRCTDAGHKRSLFRSPFSPFSLFLRCVIRQFGSSKNKSSYFVWNFVPNCGLRKNIPTAKFPDVNRRMCCQSTTAASLSDKIGVRTSK